MGQTLLWGLGSVMLACAVAGLLSSEVLRKEQRSMRGLGLGLGRLASPQGPACPQQELFTRQALEDEAPGFQPPAPPRPLLGTRAEQGRAGGFPLYFV